jgi:hypothetical protein
MSSAVHECGVTAMRHIFERPMDFVTSKYGGTWRYDTHLYFGLLQRNDDCVFPLPFTLTPDGAVSDAKSQLTLAVKISTSQDREDARETIQTFFYDSSVIAGIVLNIDETPAYVAPEKADDWDSDREFVVSNEWESSRGPLQAADQCGGAKFSCEIEIHWPGEDSDGVCFTVVSQ